MFLLLAFSGSAQEKAKLYEYWIYDTANVTCFYATYAEIPDTIAYLKDKTNGNHVIIYWDKEKKHIYQELGPGKINKRITYYRNGQLDEETDYTDSAGNRLPHDYFEWKAFYPDGKKKGEQLFEGAKRSTIYYYQNGQIKKKDVSVLGLDLKRPFDYVYVYSENFCEDGSLKWKDSVNVSGVRTTVSYHCNHNKKIQYTHNDANNFGKYQEWYENGQLKMDGQYNETVSNDSLTYFGASKEQGTWKYYNEEGKLVKEEIYSNGKIIATKEY